ncbi:MAG: gliding motility-associated ABC transporter permease subunit GldF [Marinilabiliaceae bacterium]|nr:gliding motility-associated ABC transporter permease subunit GldF [Marinilabiliaceae bacterium]
MSIYLKEIAQYFSSAVGYVVSIVFFVASGLFLWVIPSGENIIYSGYASLSPLFSLAPWLYLFLVPAISMRLISDERSRGTMELLLIRPISRLKIVLSKYFAGLTLVVITLFPTLIYVVIIWHLGQPQGNFDVGSVVGSYIGLLLLAALYMAVGVYASSLTQSQIVAFVVAMVLCYLLYAGFDALTSLPSLQGYSTYISMFGIGEHYSSISRGVLDSRDVVYFVSMTLFFVVLTSWRIRR